MQQALKLGSNIIRKHPQYIKIAGRIIWRNTTALLDYHFLKGRSFPPKSVTFRISGQCNLYCQMCIYRHAGFLDTTKMLPWAIFKKVIDAVYPYKLFVIFTGGEPLLHPNIIECLNYIREKGLYCSLTTNGCDLADLAEDIVKSGVSFLTVSIDGPEELQDRIRGRPGAYRRAMEGLKAMAKFEKRPLLVINTSIQKDNYVHIEEIVEAAIEAGVDGVNLQALWTRPPDRVALHNQLNPEYQVRDGWVDDSLLAIDFEVLDGVLKRAREKNLFVNIFPAFSSQQMHTWYTAPVQLLNTRQVKCPWMMATVFHDGTMRMCDDVIIGDLNKEGFWEIWNGERFVKFRQALNKHKNFPICAGCCSMYRDELI